MRAKHRNEAELIAPTSYMTRPSRMCPLCQENAPPAFLVLKGAPVLCNVLHISQSVATAAPRQDIQLVTCPNCTLVYNVAFQPEVVEYSPDYRNPLEVSAVFRRYAEKLSLRLIKEYDLAGGTAVEIGCGDGFFLRTLLEKGLRAATGYDPSAAVDCNQGRLRILRKLFHDDRLPEADAIICRHVLEHLPNPAGFLANLRILIGENDPIIFFEVPNARWMLESLSIWDVIYEHYTYWTSVSLQAAFKSAGFEPLSVKADFEDQFLLMEAKSGRTRGDCWPSKQEVLHTMELCSRFSEAFNTVTNSCRALLKDLRRQSRSVVLWGAGSKGVTFANLVSGHESLLAGLVDANPDKQGRYVPGCGLPVLGFDALKALRPDLILVMNKNYLQEIRLTVRQLALPTAVLHFEDLPKVLELGMAS